MPFIGNQPALSYTSFAKQDFSTSATTSYTLDNPVANANELALFINFVRQEPTTAYSASGTTLTLTSATSSSDDMYCVYLGKAVQTVNPPNASVGASQLVDASITSGKLASGVLPTNTPSFFAQLSANQTPTRGATTKIQINSELFDSNNCYDNSTNYRFTPTTAGKYYVYAMLDGDGAGTGTTLRVDLYLYKNGSQVAKANHHVVDARPVNGIGRSLVVTVDMNGTSDYLELYGMVDTTSPNDARFMGNSTIVRTGFGAYKIIGA